MTDTVHASPDVTGARVATKTAQYLRASTGRQAESDLSGGGIGDRPRLAIIHPQCDQNRRPSRFPSRKIFHGTFLDSPSTFVSATYDAFSNDCCTATGTLIGEKYPAGYR